MDIRVQGSGGWLRLVKKSSGESEPGFEKTNSWPSKMGKEHGPRKKHQARCRAVDSQVRRKEVEERQEVTEARVGREKTRCVTLWCPRTNVAHGDEGCSEAPRRPAEYTEHDSVVGAS